MDPQKKYLEFKDRFQAMSDEELKVTLAIDRKKSGWVRSRGIFLTALREAFESRSLEF